MAVQVQTNDSAALTDSDLDELASMEGAFGIGELSKAKEDWVLATVARIDGKLHGFTFSTLERIGGTPCVLIGLMSVRRSSKRDQVLRGLMAEAYHRALMAFPDEDVVVGSRFVLGRRPRRLQGARRRHAQPRLAGRRRGAGLGSPPGQALRRRGASTTRSRSSSARTASDGFIDHESTKPEAVDASKRELFAKVTASKGGALVVYGWTMAEDLVKLGGRT